MVRPTRTSRQLDNTKNRLIGFTTIAPNLDLGNGLNVSKLSELTADLQAQLDEYNSTIVRLNQMSDRIKAQEKAIAHLSGKMLSAVGLIYGNDSDQYQMAGGKKRQRNGTSTQNTSSSVMPMIELNTSNGNGSDNGNGNGNKVKVLDAQ
jgi:hypothetical protein